VLVPVAASLLMLSSFVAGKILLTACYLVISLVGWRFFVAAFAAAAPPSQ
jgi:hypothetical protein